MEIFDYSQWVGFVDYIKPDLLELRKNAYFNMTKESVQIELPRILGCDGYAVYQIDARPDCDHEPKIIYSDTINRLCQTVCIKCGDRIKPSKWERE